MGRLGEIGLAWPPRHPHATSSQFLIAQRTATTPDQIAQNDEGEFFPQRQKQPHNITNKQFHNKAHQSKPHNCNRRTATTPDQIAQNDDREFVYHNDKVKQDHIT